MEDHKVWEKVKSAESVKHKWRNEIKRNGILWSRLVACGYSQVPGIDFTNVYSPVVNDVTFRIMMVAEMVYKYKSKLIDIETAFLHGQLEDDEIVFMDCPHAVLYTHLTLSTHHTLPTSVVVVSLESTLLHHTAI